QHGAKLLTEPKPDNRVLALAAFAALRLEEKELAASHASDPYSPWDDASGWRIAGGRATGSVRLAWGDATTPIAVTYTTEGYDFRIGEEAVAVSGSLGSDGDILARVRSAAGEVTLPAVALAAGDGLTL